MSQEGVMGMSGTVGVRVIRANEKQPSWLRRAQWNLRSMWLRARQKPTMRAYSELYARVFRADGTVEDRGLIATKKVTDVFVALLCDYMQAIGTPANIGNFKYHTSGTGVAAEDNNDVVGTFTTPDTAQLGSQAEGASAWIYKSIATIAYSGAKAVTEHGIADNATWASGTLLDRSVFSVINVGNGDSIEFTYQLTIQAEA